MVERVCGCGKVGWAFLVLAIFLPGAPDLQAQTSISTWKLSPLVTPATPIPDLPGGHITEIGEVFLRPSGELVFWGKVSPRDEKWSWCLFSFRGNTLRTILEGGKEVTSRYSADASARFLVRPFAGVHQTHVANGRHCYINCPGGGVFSPAGSIFIWDGERLRPLLRPGDSLQMDGRAFTVANAVLINLGSEGDPLIYFKAKQPEKIEVRALLDGETVRPIDLGALGLRGGQAQIRIQNPVVPGPEWLIMVTGKGIQEGLYALSPTKARLLLAKGAPFPFQAGRTIQDISVLYARSAKRFVTQIWADNGSSRYFFHEGEKILDLIPPEVREMKDWGFTIHQAEILPGEAPGFLYKGVATLGPSSIVQEGNQWVEKKTMTAQQVWFFDGSLAKRLTSLRVAFSPNFAQILTISGPASPGLLFRVNLSALGDKDLSKWNSTGFLDFRDPTAGFKPLPQFEVQGGRKVGLDSIAACPSPGEFIARLPDGLFRLSEVPPPVRP